MLLRGLLQGVNRRQDFADEIGSYVFDTAFVFGKQYSYRLRAPMPTASQPRKSRTAKGDSDGGFRTPRKDVQTTVPYSSPRRIDIRFPKTYFDQRFGSVRQGGKYADISDLLKYYRLKRPEQWPPLNRNSRGTSNKFADVQGSKLEPHPRRLSEEPSRDSLKRSSSQPYFVQLKRSQSDPNLSESLSRNILRTRAIEFWEQVLGHGVSDPNISEIGLPVIENTPRGQEYRESNASSRVPTSESLGPSEGQRQKKIAKQQQQQQQQSPQQQPQQQQQQQKKESPQSKDWGSHSNYPIGDWSLATNDPSKLWESEKSYDQYSEGSATPRGVTSAASDVNDWQGNRPRKHNYSRSQVKQNHRYSSRGSTPRVSYDSKRKENGDSNTANGKTMTRGTESTSSLGKDVPVSSLGSVQSSRLQQLTAEKKLKTLEPVRKFTSPPEEHHLTACLEYPGTDVTHHGIMKAANEVLRHFESRVIRVEFVPRNVILGIGWCSNRWLVTIDNEKAFGILIGQGVIIKGEKVKCKPFDQVLGEEYRRYIDNKDTKRKTRPRAEMNEMARKLAESAEIVQA